MAGCGGKELVQHAVHVGSAQALDRQDLAPQRDRARRVSEAPPRLVRDEDLALRQEESTDHVVLEGRSEVSVSE